MDNKYKEIDEMEDFPMANDPPTFDNEFAPPSSDDQIRENYIAAIMSALGFHQTASTSSGTTTLPPLPPFPYPPFTPRQTLPDKPQHSPPTRNLPTRTLLQDQPTIPPPYPWAGNRRCRVRTLAYLLSVKRTYIRGQVHCHKCNETYEMYHNVGLKFKEISDFVHKNVEGMRHRAHEDWMNPVRLNCRRCMEEKSVCPVIPEKKQNINWLFLLLGQMLGFCSLQQLKYFCKHTSNYRTGGRDTLLFRVYLDLCRQVDPTDQGFSV